MVAKMSNEEILRNEVKLRAADYHIKKRAAGTAERLRSEAYERVGESVHRSLCGRVSLRSISFSACDGMQVPYSNAPRIANNLKKAVSVYRKRNGKKPCPRR